MRLAFGHWQAFEGIGVETRIGVVVGWVSSRSWWVVVGWVSSRVVAGGVVEPLCRCPTSTVQGNVGDARSNSQQKEVKQGTAPLRKKKKAARFLSVSAAFWGAVARGRGALCMLRYVKRGVVSVRTVHRGDDQGQTFVSLNNSPPVERVSPPSSSSSVHCVSFE